MTSADRLPRLPPLNALRVFDAASRLGSLTRAAQALRITQSAVSRQIALLEAHLGQSLFERERHGVRLTRAGDAYAKAITPALAGIAEASERLTAATRSEPLTLSCYNVFAVKWLIPRLPRFQAAHPRIAVRVSQSTDLLDPGGDQADLAIRYGDGRWPELNGRLLLADHIQPVCSPKLLRAHPALRAADGLRQVRLLHTALRPQDWPDWLAAFGPREEPTRSMEFPSLLMTYQAAVDGLGVAMGQLSLLEQELARGSLVALFGRNSLQRPLGYHAVWPRGQRRSARLQSLVAWLLSEASAAPP